MKRAEIYQMLYRKILKVSIFFIIGLVCLILFLATKRVKEPLLAIEFMDQLKNAKAASILLEALNDSFVPQEKLETKARDENSEVSGSEIDGFVSRRYYPQYSILLEKSGESSPLEAHMASEEEAIPFKAKDSRLDETNACWNLEMAEKIKVGSIDASKMTPRGKVKFLEFNRGWAFLDNGEACSPVELSAGLKEFCITASVLSGSYNPPDFDPTCRMAASLDGFPIAKFYVHQNISKMEMAKYSFQCYVEKGWHTFGIAFENNYYFYDGTQEIKRQLWVRETEIYELKQAVCLMVRKGLEERYLFQPYTLSYFRSLPREERNELIRFFKSRFNILNLKEAVLKGLNVETLIKDVNIASLTKEAVFAPVPTKIRLKLKVPIDGIKLVFGYGIMQEAWDKPGDGVVFQVRLDTKEGEEETVLFSKYINPKVNQEDRKWHEGTVDLLQFAGKEIGLVFETLGSVISPIKKDSDTAYDYAVWSK